MYLKERYNSIVNKYKNLDESIVPTAEDQQKFEQWKIRERKKMLMAIICALFILISVGIVIIYANIAENLKEAIVVIIIYLVFSLAMYTVIKKYIKSRHWKMEYCNYGIVTNKYYNPGRKNSRYSNKYHVIVSINNKNVNINTCTVSEYRNLEINDEVIIFAVDNKHLYLIKK